MLPWLADAAADLFLGSACVGCRRPGRALCDDCRGTLPAGGALAWPTPTPAGLVPPFAGGDYADLLRAMVLAHKERRAYPLAEPLGGVLAAVASAALVALAAGSTAPAVLVPVPSRPAAVRARGHDPTTTMARHAAGVLRRTTGREAVLADLLRLRPGVADQAGLTSGERKANLHGSMACPSAAVHRLRTRVPEGFVVICDDVITTGATLREAQRALAAVGIDAVAAATVAATRRRRARNGTK